MTPYIHRLLIILSLCSFVYQWGCSTDQTQEALLTELPPESEGPYKVANTTIEAIDSMRDRVLTLELWYPSIEESRGGESPVNFEQAESSRIELAELYDLAPSQCPTRMTNSHRDGRLLSEQIVYPLVLFSHCHNCVRYSSFSLAERLASHGIIVVSVDHAGPLPFLPMAVGERLSPSQLDTRLQDLQFIMDSALNGELFLGSDLLKNILIDPERIGVFGHSFGSVTAAFFARQETKVQAVAGLAAPMQNPLFPGFSMTDLNIPTFLLLAEEDNSIGEIGNRLIRSNFEQATAPIWKLDIADSGHWSLSDLCGLNEVFSPGCGRGIRHSDKGLGESFDYLPVADGIDITQKYLSAFFLAHLAQRQDALHYLNLPSEDTRYVIQHKL